MLRSILCLFWSLVFTALSAQTYSILTWNIRYDNAGDSLDRWDRRKASLAAEILSRKPELIGLQEALAHQVDFFDEHIKGYERYGVGRDDGIRKGEFSPVYFDTTVFTLFEGRTIWLSPKPDVPSKGWDAAHERIATQVILLDKKTGDTLWVMNTHWDHAGEQARKKSGELIQELLASPIARGKHVLLMGDLNATADDEPIAALRQWLMDSCPAERAGDGTFNGFRTDPTAFKRIDHVWHSPKNWEVRSYDVPHPTVNGRHVSDHFPVVVQLRAIDTAIRRDTLVLYDAARDRRVPIAIYGPADMRGSNLVLLSHGYNENRPGTYLLYSYLAEHLAVHGYAVVSIQHELRGDDPLAVKGDLQVLRRPNWERGVKNIRFVMEEMQRLHPELDHDHTSLIGHSNGGDISVLFGHEHPSLVESVITLDNRRMPFPCASHPRLLSLRASDAVADKGVVPTAEEQRAFGIRIVRLANTKHAEMNDRANAEQRAEINRLVLEFLKRP